MVKNPPANANKRRRFDPWVRKIPWRRYGNPGQGSCQSSVLAWRIPWRGEPGGLQPMGSQKVGRDCTRIIMESCTQATEAEPKAAPSLERTEPLCNCCQKSPSRRPDPILGKNAHGSAHCRCPNQPFTRNFLCLEAVRIGS